MAEAKDTKDTKKESEPKEVPVADRLTDTEADPAQTKSPVYGD